MSALTTKLAMAATATAMVVGLSAAPVAASSRHGGDETTTTTTTVNVDKSTNVNGDCSGVVNTDVDQDSTQVAGNGAENEAENVNVLPILPIGNDQNATADNNQSNSQSSNQSSTVTFAPDCSVTNVAAAQAAPQVSAPKGGVEAGAGSAMGSLLGFGGSVTAAGAGVLRFFRRGQ